MRWDLADGESVVPCKAEQKNILGGGNSRWKPLRQKRRCGCVRDLTGSNPMHVTGITRAEPRAGHAVLCQGRTGRCHS